MTKASIRGAEKGAKGALKEVRDVFIESSMPQFLRHNVQRNKMA